MVYFAQYDYRMRKTYGVMYFIRFFDGMNIVGYLKEIIYISGLLMSESIAASIKDICHSFGNDHHRLMDIARAVQKQFGCVNDTAINCIAQQISIPRVEVESLVSFYTFLSKEQKGKIVIRLCDDIIDKLHGYDRVARIFCDELGIEIGQTTPDGAFTLETTSCIGMCDQAPAALVNEVVITELSSDKAREIIQQLKKHMDPEQLIHTLGDGENSNDLIHSMVKNHLHKTDTVIFSNNNRGEAIRKALAMSPIEVIRSIKAARLRGRGGAGFPTGMKWEFARSAEGERKFIMCNADEGEPGTFKDRVILTEKPDRVFAGMTIAGYAIGASEGIVYLRAEYEYLLKYLEDILQKRRTDGLLGKNINGNTDFNFDIRIQMGAGAYICGEETALISSCEGKRGDPKNRPPFPAQKGYLGYPTVVNNVETLCCVTKILELGPASFREYGCEQSTGTKLLSISGDCKRPGVYEVPFGISIDEILKMTGARDTAAIQIGGPSGQMIGPDQFNRTISYEDLATGGSIMIFNSDRNLLEVVLAFMSFFEEESCGYCTPCRVGNVLLKRTLENIIAGRGEPADLDLLQKTAKTMKSTSRCGLGQTSCNPVLTTLKNFKPVYDALVHEDPDGFNPSFDLKQQVSEAEKIIDRESVHC